MTDKPNAATVFAEKKRADQIFDLATQALTVQQIADKLGVTEENVRKVMNLETTKMTLRMQEFRESWSSITLQRTEWLLSRLMPAIAKQTEEPGAVPSKDLVKMALDIYRFQQTIAAPKEEADKPKSPDVVINQTFNSSGPLYDEALQQLQGNLFGYTVHNVEEPMLIMADEKLVRLEELASQVLTEGEMNATEPDE